MPVPLLRTWIDCIDVASHLSATTKAGRINCQLNAEFAMEMQIVSPGGFLGTEGISFRRTEDEVQRSRDHLVVSRRWPAKLNTGLSHMLEMHRQHTGKAHVSRKAVLTSTARHFKTCGSYLPRPCDCSSNLYHQKNAEIAQLSTFHWSNDSPSYRVQLLKSKYIAADGRETTMCKLVHPDSS
jgi:hypothetical protein